MDFKYNGYFRSLSKQKVYKNTDLKFSYLVHLLRLAGFKIQDFIESVPSLALRKVNKDLYEKTKKYRTF